MKYKYIACLLFCVTIVVASGCKKLLEEQPRISFAPSFFTTNDGIQGGIAGIYSSFRGQWGTQIFTQLFNTGTDESLKGAAADVQHWFTYNNSLIKSQANDYEGFWNTLFIGASCIASRKRAHFAVSSATALTPPPSAHDCH